MSVERWLHAWSNKYDSSVKFGGSKLNTWSSDVSLSMVIEFGGEFGGGNSRNWRDHKLRIVYRNILEDNLLSL